MSATHADPAPIRAVILAGGSGARLWPLSRARSPKQFSKVAGDRSLLEETVARLHGLVHPSAILAVTSEETAAGEGFLDLLPYEKLLEPVARSTAAAIGVAAVRYALEGIDPILVVLPADHLIRDIGAFQASLRAGIAQAAQGRLVVFGITPARAETSFGYIEAAAPGTVARVKSFREKPDLPGAERYLAAGNCYWNSGIFAWKASAILKEISAFLPELASVLDDLRTAAKDVAGLPAAMKKCFAAAPSISIDKGVLEKSPNLVVVRGDFDWSDVGSWDAVYDVSAKDLRGNAVSGNVVAIDCDNTLVRAQGRLVAALGLDGISVVETPDAVLVTRRGESQRVAEIVRALEERSATEHLFHATVKRPWGSYTVLEESPHFKIKRIEVRVGGRLSLQRHKHRSEHWVVVSGRAAVTCADRRFAIGPNESTFIPAGVVHRLENDGDVALQIIEVQVGSYVGEDDIERLEDPYGRPAPRDPRPT